MGNRFASGGVLRQNTDGRRRLQPDSYDIYDQIYALKIGALRRLTQEESSNIPIDEQVWYITQDGYKNNDCTGAVLTKQDYKLHCNQLNDTFWYRMVIDSAIDCTVGKLLYYKDDPGCKNPPIAVSDARVSVTAIVNNQGRDVETGVCFDGFKASCTDEALPATLVPIAGSRKVLVAHESPVNCSITNNETDLGPSTFHMLTHIDMSSLQYTTLYSHLDTCNRDPGIVANNSLGYFMVSEVGSNATLFTHYSTLADCKANENSIYSELQSLGCTARGVGGGQTFLRTEVIESKVVNPSLCLWQTGCSEERGGKPTFVPPNSCMPGTHCHEEYWWSQCQENPYITLPDGCFTTVNGPFGGHRWGCKVDSDCCNPEATCRTDRLCHLPCWTNMALDRDVTSDGGGSSGAARTDDVVVGTGVAAGVLLVLLTVGAAFLYRRRNKTGGIEEASDEIEDQIEIHLE
jgi:hypothetical protein